MTADVPEGSSEYRTEYKAAVQIQNGGLQVGAGVPYTGLIYVFPARFIKNEIHIRRKIIFIKAGNTTL